MKAIIIAAGMSTRLRPLTDKVPKPMLEVGGQKILERTIGQLKQAGALEIIINTHYLPEVISDYFGDGKKFGVSISYYHEDTLIGTAGALKRMGGMIGGEPFLFIYGDNVFVLDFKKFIESSNRDYLATIAVFDKTINSYSGAAGGVVAAEQGLITEFWAGKDRPDLNLVNAGLYMLKPEVLNYIPENTVYDFHKDVFPRMLGDGKQIGLYTLPQNEAVFGVDTPEFLKVTEDYFKNREK